MRGVSRPASRASSVSAEYASMMVTADVVAAKATEYRGGSSDVVLDCCTQTVVPLHASVASNLVVAKTTEDWRRPLLGEAQRNGQ